MVDKSRRAFLTTPRRVVARAPAADAPAAPPRFEHVSIEPTVLVEDDTAGPSESSTRCTCHPDGRFVAERAPIRWLLKIAYGHRPPAKLRIADIDRSFLDAKYNITAHAGGPYEAQKRRGALPADAAAMLRTLLREYFGVRATLRSASGDVFELRLAREDRTLGPNLHPADAGAPDGGDSAGHVTDSRRIRTVENGLELRRTSMSGLSVFLARCPAIRTTVIDRTGLTGEFDIDLRFAGNRGRSRRESPDTDLPPLTQALEEQLYLKLHKVPGTLPVLVVERLAPAQSPKSAVAADVQ